jgi:hypothetical protein
MRLGLNATVLANCGFFDAGVDIVSLSSRRHLDEA